MKKLIFLSIVCMGLSICPNSFVNAQGVGINSSGSPADPSAGLDVNFVNKGTLITRMTTAQRNSISLPANSLLIYNTDVNCLQICISGQWQNIYCDVNCSSAPATPSAIIGNAAPCQNTSGIIYSIAQVDGATYYNWTVPPGASITSGQGTTSIIVSTGTSSGNVTVTASNKCGVSATQTLAITIQLVPSQPSVIIGGSSVCQNQNGVSYSVTNVSGVTYTWAYSGQGFSCASGCNTNSITASFSASATTGTLTVTPSNACGSGSVRTFAITVNSTAPSTLTVGTHSASATQITWNWNSASGAAGYKYNTNNDYSTATDNGANLSYTQTGLTACNSYTLYIWAYNACGISGVTTLTQSAADWIQLFPNSSSPAGREAPGLAWDGTGNRMWMFGGSGNNDLWSYTPSSNVWAQLLPSSSPAARSNSSAVWDPGAGKLLIFGGSSGTYLNDLWSYLPSTNTWTQLNISGPPPIRAYQTTVWDPVNNKMLVYGGYNGSFLGDLWAYSPSGNSWSQINPTGGPPAARYGHIAVWDAANSRMLIFGGNSSTGFRNDLWAYSPSGNSWTLLSPTGGPPTARFIFSAAWDVVNNRMLIFGGNSNGVTYRNDLWALSSSANTWTQLSPSVLPPARRVQGSIWNAANNKMLMFGGDSSTGSLNDLWQYCP